jgi:hypothetical protein
MGFPEQNTCTRLYIASLNGTGLDNRDHPKVGARPKGRRQARVEMAVKNCWERAAFGASEQALFRADITMCNCTSNCDQNAIDLCMSDEDFAFMSQIFRIR